MGNVGNRVRPSVSGVGRLAYKPPAGCGHLALQRSGEASGRMISVPTGSDNISYCHNRTNYAKCRRGGRPRPPVLFANRCVTMRAAYQKNRFLLIALRLFLFPQSALRWRFAGALITTHTPHPTFCPSGQKSTFPSRGRQREKPPWDEASGRPGVVFLIRGEGIIKNE